MHQGNDQQAISRLRSSRHGRAYCAACTACTACSECPDALSEQLGVCTPSKQRAYRPALPGPSDSHCPACSACPAADVLRASGLRHWTVVSLLFVFVPHIGVTIRMGAPKIPPINGAHSIRIFYGRKESCRILTERKSSSWRRTCICTTRCSQARPFRLHPSPCQSSQKSRPLSPER